MRQVALVTYCMTVWTFSTKSAGNMRGTCWDSEIWPPKPIVIAIYGCCWNCFFKRPLTTRKQEDPAHIPNLDIFGGFWWHFWSPYDFSTVSPWFPHGFPMHLGNVRGSLRHGRMDHMPILQQRGVLREQLQGVTTPRIWMGSGWKPRVHPGCEVQHRVTASTKQHIWSYVIIIYYPYWRVETTWRTPIPKSRRNGRPTPMVQATA